MENIFIGMLTIKIVVGFAFLFFIINLTGKTSINQLSTYHLVFVLVLGDLLGNTLYDEQVKVYQFLYATGLWTLCMLGIEFITQKKKSTRFLLEGNPSILIRDGILDREMLSKNKLDINEVASLLRQNNVFSVREVKYGILEQNGNISILLKSKYENPKRQDLNLPENPVDLPVSLIIDGEILLDNLQEIGFDQKWLKKELQANGYHDEKGIFFADWRDSEGIHISPK
ncbi:DUF421 domain-containing protein [Domibacillus aminovorans]|uniref:DUF421 domain-containing protein n=1 Tax=Domibacillus aminovorans TaxID=29332 RepID=A0A177L3Z2_9BACI|nr:DUF421 domain-containing protein [Domibacillus aminovorans]OAH60409.1 hypothetical protein AWH49_16235 [Domibacillus aminovorans]